MTKVSRTPTEVGVAKCFMSRSARGVPINAPPPNPMIAIPVAMPRRSGNHLMSVETGEMYPSPRPHPPITPEPIQSIQIWWRWIPRAEIMNPPPQQNAAATPALRGPTRSSHPPNTAAEEPRNTKKSVYIQPRVLIFQSQVVANSVATKLMSWGQGTDWVMPMARLSGSQNTLKPYAMPMERWIASAAGGTSHRLKPGRATIRSRSRTPTVRVLAWGSDWPRATRLLRNGRYLLGPM